METVAAGGAGTIRPGGGILLFSASGSFTAVGAGASGAFADSTIGTLSLYYGSGNFGSGYKFMPIYMETLSFSTKGPADWIADDTGGLFSPINITTSGSVWMISAMKVSAGGSATFASAVGARLLILGFIVSTP